MIDEDQHIQMQHGMFVPDFQQLRMNGLLPVLHESMHQVEAIVELAVTAHGSRSLQCKPGDCVVARGTTSSHHDEVPLDVLEPRNTWQQPPALKAKLLKQFQARVVLSEDQTDDCIDLKRWRTRDCFFQQAPRHAATPEFFIDINADFGRSAIRAARSKRF